jgi:hypothetical protein
MLIKNNSFVEVNAVGIDGKVVTNFQPQEEKQVTEEEGIHFMQRYNGEGKIYFKEVTPSVAPTSKPVEEVVEPTSEFQCPVCGKVCDSKAGLGSHMRTHK